MYERAEQRLAKTWAEVEDDYLRAMEQFDGLVANGDRPPFQFLEVDPPHDQHRSSR
jgi:hypothetical protein